MARFHTLMVLDDGETYSGLHGCSILVVTDEGMEQIIEVADASAVTLENVVSHTYLSDAGYLQAQADTDDEGNDNG